MQRGNLTQRPDGLFSHTITRDQGTYETLSGFVLHRMQRIPREGDHFDWGGFRFEVADVDGHRLDKILIQRLAWTEPEASNSENVRTSKS